MTAQRFCGLALTCCLALTPPPSSAAVESVTVTVDCTGPYLALSSNPPAPCRDASGNWTTVGVDEGTCGSFEDPLPPGSTVTDLQVSLNMATHHGALPCETCSTYSGCDCGRIHYERTELALGPAVGPDYWSLATSHHCSCHIIPSPGTSCDWVAPACGSGFGLSDEAMLLPSLYTDGGENFVKLRTWDECLRVEFVELTIEYIPPVDLYLTQASPSGQPQGGDITSTYVPVGCPHLVADGACPQVILVAELGPGLSPLGLSADFVVQSSRHEGIAMNAVRADLSPTADDYHLGLPVGDTGQSTASAAFDASGIAFSPITVTDFGGAATMTVTVPGLVGTRNTTTISIPLDLDGNSLPDAGWSIVDETGAPPRYIPDPGLSACSDEDTLVDSMGGTPTQQQGDGLTAWEEYRGFFAERQHRRTDPFKKDHFFSLGGLPPTAAAVVSRLPTNDHLVVEDLADPARSEFQVAAFPAPTLGRTFHRRVINGYGRQGCGAEQRGNHLALNTVEVPGGLPWGQTFFEANELNDTCLDTTACVLLSEVYLASIFLSTPPRRFTLPAQPDGTVDNLTAEFTLAHEAGHGIGMDHYEYGVREAPCPGDRWRPCRGRFQRHPRAPRDTCTPTATVGPRSIMVNRGLAWARETCPGCNDTDCTGNLPSGVFANLPTSFDDVDVADVTLQR